MRSKKWLTFITFGIAVIALIIALIIALLVGKDSRCVGYDISMATFGSALLGFIMSLTEYFVERRRAMEHFWQEARGILAQLRKVKYIELDAPKDLIMECFKEEYENDLSISLGDSPNNEARNKLIGWYEENVPMFWSETDNISAELNRIYEKKIAGYHKEYEKCFDNYVMESKIDMDNLGNAYAGLDFIFSNKKIRENIAFNAIYNKMLEMRKLFNTEGYHFEFCRDGKGNFPVCVDKANDICSKVFFEEQKIENGFDTKVVYQKIYDDIDMALENFRVLIYPKEKPNYPPRIPVTGGMHCVNFETGEN